MKVYLVAYNGINEYNEKTNQNEYGAVFTVLGVFSTMEKALEIAREKGLEEIAKRGGTIDDFLKYDVKITGLEVDEKTYKGVFSYFE